ncbi:MAG: aconitate hydratase AcnA [Gammaproteobacteria bacterium]|nr:aconitate hydratase AcnA [Gammaproteobacteria bacterium]
MYTSNDSFGARSTLSVGSREYEIFRLDSLERLGFDIGRLPYSIRVLLENLLRCEDGVTVRPDDIRALAAWDPQVRTPREIPFTPARVLLQDFTGVPALVDLAAMRDAMHALGGDPKKINPTQPVELVIDHSIQVDAFGSPAAFDINEARDYERNAERYAFIKWGAQAFENFSVSPPNGGICHQINLEHLARVVFGTGADATCGHDGMPQAYPDTLVGTDSHTPMVNGLGVLGWGVGGIEAEAAMLGQPISMLIPEVIGVRLVGTLAPGATATDLVLTVAEMLRKEGVVGKFVEFFGPGLSTLPVPDRATIGNMSPEYGCTCSMFPVDRETLQYLRFTGRSEEHIALVEAYMREQGLFHTEHSPEPLFTKTLELDLSKIRPSIAGPRRPQDRIPLSRARKSFEQALPTLLTPSARSEKTAAAATPNGRKVGVWGESSEVDSQASGAQDDEPLALHHGSVVIAAITSCTNTSNPSVMIGAGLLARKAAARGLTPKPWVKTSLAPGSRVVADYYKRSGLLTDLEALGFHITGFGCTTCIGNSGPLPEPVSAAIRERSLVVAAVLSGNRNFEGRIHSEVRANYLMSPPLVIAFAIAGRIDIDLETEPLGVDQTDRPVYLKDIWPSPAEVDEVIRSAIDPAMYERNRTRIYTGDVRWQALQAPQAERFPWDERSNYIRRPPYFDGMTKDAPQSFEDLRNARALLVLGDSVTTDHISPAGSIQKDSPAGRYLIERGVAPQDFNSYGSRRGNHEVMVRGTFANVRLRNRLAGDLEGPFTKHLPSGEVMPIYDAAMRYAEEGIPLIVLAGKEYGSGSSRDWAAKGVFLQGVRAVIAESFERIHRSNLVGMGVLPLQFQTGESAASLQLSGEEIFDIVGLADAVRAHFANGKVLTVRARRPNGDVTEFQVFARIDTPKEAQYYRHGGILQYALRQLISGPEETPSLAISEVDGPSTNVPDTLIDEASMQSFPASDPPAL